MITAGLLARPAFDAFPSRVRWTVAKDFQKLNVGLTAAGTAPDFHRIPSLVFSKINFDNKP
jgi:hypothetical protein